MKISSLYYCLKISLLNSIILISFFWLPFSKAQEAPAVQVKVDSTPADSTYKSEDDIVFSIQEESCRIEWTASRSTEGNRWLVVRRDCAMPFTKQMPLHRAILQEIQKRQKLSEFKSIYWGSLCGPSDWGFCLPITKAALSSKDYQDYRKNYPHSKLKALNGLFVELAKQTQAYRELETLMAEFGVKIKLNTVEKVFALPFKKLPFYDQMKGLSVKGNPTIMYDAGMNYFDLF